ncbi:hypothetical protein VTN31DRAFT_4293 [Thermomyces dupontii]|uniref:uncharacterized protein n=1 Tax=Talaromyces thermophilus TaxID=28565 RepID=UPI003744477F
MVSPWGHSISFSLDPESGQEPRDTLDPGSTSSGGRSPQEPEPVPDDVARWLTIGDTNRNLVAVKLFPGTMGIKSSPDSSFRGSDSPGSSSMVVEVGESNPPPMAPVTESFGELHTTDQHHFGHQSSHVVALSAIAPLGMGNLRVVVPSTSNKDWCTGVLSTAESTS